MSEIGKIVRIIKRKAEKETENYPYFSLTLSAKIPKLILPIFRKKEPIGVVLISLTDMHYYFDIIIGGLYNPLEMRIYFSSLPIKNSILIADIIDAFPPEIEKYKLSIDEYEIPLEFEQNFNMEFFLSAEHLSSSYNIHFEELEIMERIKEEILYGENPLPLVFDIWRRVYERKMKGEVKSTEGRVDVEYGIRAFLSSLLILRYNPEIKRILTEGVKIINEKMTTAEEYKLYLFKMLSVLRALSLIS